MIDTDPGQACQHPLCCAGLDGAQTLVRARLALHYVALPVPNFLVFLALAEKPTK